MGSIDFPHPNLHVQSGFISLALASNSIFSTQFSKSSYFWKFHINDFLIFNLMASQSIIHGIFYSAIQISPRVYIERNLQPNYTIQCILCHMVFYGIEATFLLTFLMNKLANILISTLHVWYILHPNIYVMRYCHG